MKTMRQTGIFFIMLLALSACQQTNGPKDNQNEQPLTASDSLWKLDTDKSQITYISTKNGDIEEHNTLRFLTGSIDADKQVQLIIDLTSIDTNIDIRNQRMRELFFETDEFPTASIEAVIPNNLPLMTPYNITFSLTLKGQQHSFQNPVMIHSGGEEMMVTSAESLTVSAETFSLKGALDNLREIAGLNSISPTIQVEYKLHFKQTK